MSIRELTAKLSTPLIIYSAFFLRAFSFILLLPLFTRVIEPATWGGVLAAQALAVWLTLLIDFGFSLSLARKLAVERESIKRVREYIGNVYSAKILLLIPAVLICWLASTSGILEQFYAFAWWALAYAVAQGFSPIWYYQATEKMFHFSIIEIVGRLLYIVLAVLLVKSTKDAYIILALQTLTSFAIGVVSIGQLRRQVGRFLLSFQGGMQALREGFMLSAFALLTSIYTTAGTFIFGFFSSPTNVATYGNADRLIRTGISLLGPLNQMLLPRSARAFAAGRQEGFELVKRFLVIYSALGVIGFIAGWFLAPVVVSLLFGEQYAESATYLRGLLILFPLTAINTVIVSHILIPNERDLLITKLYAFVSLISLILIIILVPKLNAWGMIYSMIAPEVIAFLVLMAYSLKLRLEVSD